MFARIKKATPRKVLGKFRYWIFGAISGVGTWQYRRSIRGKLSDRKVFFDHIPKCGGSSLSQLFCKVYGADRVAPPLMGEQALVAKKLFRNYDVVLGHFGGTIFDNWPEDFFCCTLVRDPVDRALSTYFYFQNLPQLSIPYVEAVRGLSLDEFVESTRQPIVNEILNNPLVAHFAAASGYDGSYSDPAGVWEAAVRGFNSYDVIGVCEDFEKSAQAIFGALGVPVPQLDYKNYKVNSNKKRQKRSDIPVHIISAIERRNAGDIQLYRAAVERLNGRPYQQFLGLPESLKEKKQRLRCKLNSVEVKGAESGNTTVKSGETMSIRIRLSLSEDIAAFRYFVKLRNEANEILFGMSSDELHGSGSLSKGEHEIEVVLDMLFKYGKYFIGFTFGEGGDLTEPVGVDLVWITSDTIATFEVAGNIGTSFFGACKLPVRAISIT